MQDDEANCVKEAYKDLHSKWIGANTKAENLLKDGIDLREEIQRRNEEIVFLKELEASRGIMKKLDDRSMKLDEVLAAGSSESDHRGLGYQEDSKAESSGRNLEKNQEKKSASNGIQENFAGNDRVQNPLRQRRPARDHKRRGGHRRH